MNQFICGTRPRDKLAYIIEMRAVFFSLRNDFHIPVYYLLQVLVISYLIETMYIKVVNLMRLSENTSARI